MAWELMQQEESIGKGETRTVLVKHVRLFPKKNRRGKLEGFGMMRWLLLKVVLKHVASGEHFWFTFNADKNTFTWHKPDRMELPFLEGVRHRGQPVRDRLAEPVKMPGEITKFSINRFPQFLTERVGAELAGKILELIAQRLGEIHGGIEADEAENEAENDEALVDAE